MKHLLNDLSSEEKNRIREQHEGGMKIDTSKFKKLIESKLGDAKPLLSEQTDRDPKSYNIDQLKIIDDETTFIYVKNPSGDIRTDPGRGFLTNNGQGVINNGECMVKDENGNPTKKEWRSNDIQTIPDGCRVRIDNKSNDGKPPYFSTPIECTKNGCVPVEKFEF